MAHLTRIPALRRLLSAALVATLAWAGTAQGQTSQEAAPAQVAQLPDGELRELTKLAFFFGMHPVGMYELRYVTTQLKGSSRYVGDGRMYWDRKPRSASDRNATTPNATTLYGAAFFDLGREPVVVMTPAVPDRYFSVQAADQYPRWYFMAGNQFTGREAQTHLIVGPDYKGPYPDEIASVNVHPAPSNFAMVLARYALKSNEPQEIAAVNALMDQTSVVPLSVWRQAGGKAVNAQQQPVVEGAYPTVPRMKDLVSISTSLKGLDLLQMVSLVLNDPSMTLRKDSAKQIATLQRLSRLGLAPGVRFDPAWLSDAQKLVVEAAFVEAKAESERHVRTTATKAMGGGWRLGGAELMPDLDDYVKQGYYGLTAIGAPIDARSHAGAFGFADTEGKLLNGRSKYTITFDMKKLPPVTEFWELPVYDADGYFVPNELDRYSINSFMLERGALHVDDGDKLVIYVQRDKPTDPAQLRNWLPVPEAGFRFAFRFYGPKGSLIDGSYAMPGIVRTP